MILTIRRKILLAFLAVSLITGALGAYATHSIGVAGRLVAETFDRSLMSIDYARAAATDFATIGAVLARRRLAEGQPERQAELDAREIDLTATLRDDLAIAGTRALAPRVAKAANTVSESVARWLAASARLRDQPQGAAAWRDLDDLQTQVDSDFDILVNLAAGDGFRHREQALAETATIRRITRGALAVALALSGGVAVALARRIMKPVRAASAAASAIAAGQLSTPIPPAGGDELGQLLGAMAVMRDAIRGMMEREVAQRRSAQARLADALASSSEGVMLIDPAGRVAIANPRLAALFPALAADLAPGTPIARLLGLAFSRDVFTTDGPGDRRALRGRLLALGTVPVELRLAGGGWLRISGSTTADGGMVAICGDITALKQREADLEQANLRLDAALNNMTQGLCLYGPDRTLRLANRRFVDLFQMDEAALEEDVRAIARLGQPARFVRVLASGLVVETLCVPLADGGWVATFEDITQRRQSEREIAFLARHDPLTRLPNRAHLGERLELAVAGLGRGGCFALMCLDLDRFKPVNDLLGHGVGDKLLCAVGERLTFCVREIDMVARLGGDEFAIVQTDINRPEQTGKLAQRLIGAMARPFDIDGHQISIGVSIGITLAPDDGQLGETLLKHADIALSRAKLDGRGTYRSFEAGMDARLQARRTMERDLRRALAADEFELHYQPLVDLATGRVTGFEALLRWHHPTRGMVSPGEFIPVIEEIGLIVPVGQWVIRAACAEAASWPDPVRVAVNVSPLQFKDPRLVEVVAEALAQSGLPGRRLEIEVTESVLLSDSEATLDMLRRLRGLGARISMDDFGTGYSSLSYLRSFPFDKIKIDQSFVRGLRADTEAAVIVGAIVGLGRSLGMRTLAEGVETDAELAQLRVAGCDEVQGYLFSRPRPAGEVPALIARIGGEVMAAQMT